ncbi:hypothetical protein LguiA_008703 [Lonicera macranthoides]
MIPLIFCLSLILILPNIIFSQSIVKNLPGYPGELPFKLETGYIGVGEEEDVQLFYYFVESERSPQFDPLIIWLAGGPGCSALRAFFYEIGPLVFNYANSSGSKPILELNPYSWTSVANIIFLDAPVNTGFSYSKTWQSYNSSDTLSAAHTTEFLRKWVIDHPRFTNNRLYVTGVSYSGIIIPMIIEELYKGNEARTHPLINIKGYMIGNPLTDKYSDINSRIPYAHRLTLLSDELYKSIKTNCNGDYIQVAANNTPCLNDMQLLKECIERINIQCILEPVCAEVTGKQNLLEWDPNSFEDNPIKLPFSRPQVPAPGPWCRGYNYVYVSIWANDRAVQDALNVREGTVEEWWLCNVNSTFSFPAKETSSYTFDVLSVVDYHRNLTKKRCRALIFSGDHDMLVPHLGTEKWIRSLNLTVEDNWAPWLVEGQVAGYTETHSYNEYTLAYATVKGAGHTATEFKPKECLAMVDRWFAYYPL